MGLDLTTRRIHTTTPTHIPYDKLIIFAIMKKILEIFKGDNGQLSSKRFVGIIGAFVLFGTMAHNSLSPAEIAPSAELVAAVEWVTILTLGFTSIDKFSGKNNAEG